MNGVRNKRKRHIRAPFPCRNDLPAQIRHRALVQHITLSFALFFAAVLSASSLVFLQSQAGCCFTIGFPGAAACSRILLPILRRGKVGEALENLVEIFGGAEAALGGDVADFEVGFGEHGFGVIDADAADGGHEIPAGMVLIEA